MCTSVQVMLMTKEVGIMSRSYLTHLFHLLYLVRDNGFLSFWQKSLQFFKTFFIKEVVWGKLHLLSRGGE